MYFNKEAYDFLLGIRFNNNKEWYEAHKEEYRRLIQTPLNDLAKTVFALLGDEGLFTRVNRIYRDATFSPDNRFRDVFYIYYRGQVGWSEIPALYIRVAPEGFSYGVQLKQPKAGVMERFRQSLPEFLSLMPQGFLLEGERYKRPKPCENEAWLEYYTLKGVGFRKDGEVPPEALAADLRQLLPVYRYLERLVASYAEDTAKEKQQLLLEQEPVDEIPFEGVHLYEPDF